MVGGADYGAALAGQAAQQFHDVAVVGEIETGSGFVEKQYCGTLVEQRLSNLNPAALSPEIE